MKKLLVIILILQLLMFSFFCFSWFNIVYKYKHDKPTVTEFDTIINRVQIDSIHLLIVKQDCVINKININEKYEIEKAINSDDSTAIKLFKELVTK